MHKTAMSNSYQLTSLSHCGCDTPVSPVNSPVGESSATTLPCIMNPLKSGLSVPPDSVTGVKREESDS